MYFSQSTLGFYRSDWRATYEESGTWPADAQEVSPEDEEAIRAALGRGASVNRGASGWEFSYPVFNPVESGALASFRANRELALNRLSGIGFAALLAGDTEHAQEVAAVRAALLGVPALPAVRGAESAEELAAALDSAWAGAYAGATVPEIATAMAVGAGGGQTRPT